MSVWRAPLCGAPWSTVSSLHCLCRRRFPRETEWPQGWEAVSDLSISSPSSGVRGKFLHLMHGQFWKACVTYEGFCALGSTCCSDHSPCGSLSPHACSKEHAVGPLMSSRQFPCLGPHLGRLQHRRHWWTRILPGHQRAWLQACIVKLPSHIQKGLRQPTMSSL